MIQPGRALGTPEQQAVRAWLRENNNSSQWEEVRWFIVEKEKTRWFPDEYQGPKVSVVRLKYRTQGLGGTVLLDEYFAVLSGNVVENGSVSGVEQLAELREKNDQLEKLMLKEQAEGLEYLRTFRPPGLPK